MTRDIRDSLAEALYFAMQGDIKIKRPLSTTAPHIQSAWLREADRLHAALPSVGLTINTLESPSQGGETTNHG